MGVESTLLIQQKIAVSNSAQNLNFESANCTEPNLKNAYEYIDWKCKLQIIILLAYGPVAPFQRRIILLFWANASDLSPNTWNAQICKKFAECTKSGEVTFFNTKRHRFIQFLHYLISVNGTGWTKRHLKINSTHKKHG